ncbi:hypothetical protein [Kitasatospora sp. NPDC098663]|uniref:hypothetical protein n=1 Tax=Kitasatospora sp. NPDC098663 TaxID=3364096 RepID=UPI00382E65D7
MSNELREIDNSLSLSVERASIAEREAQTKQHDRFGVPLAFISVLENTRGYAFTDPYPVHELPLSLAPAVVKKAAAAARKAQDDLEAADDKAERLFAEYQAVPAQVQREITAAVERGTEPPSLSATVDERQEKLAGPLRDVIALRNALHSRAIKTASAAENARAKHRDDWRDLVAAHVAAEMPKARKRLEDVVTNLAAALNSANDLSSNAEACRKVDAQWLKERLLATECDINGRKVVSSDIATPDVYERDRETVKHRASNQFANTTVSVDVVAEAEKRIGWLGSYSDGGEFPDSLFVPLASHSPVERRDDY